MRSNSNQVRKRVRAEECGNEETRKNRIEKVEILWSARNGPCFCFFIYVIFFANPVPQVSIGLISQEEL